MYPKRTQKAALQKSEVAEYRACGAEKRGFWANRQNREIATWGNATKIVRKMPRLFTPNWTSAAFRHRLSSTSLKGWAVYALSESP